jgi:hypothetical protein
MHRRDVTNFDDFFTDQPTRVFADAVELELRVSF